MNLLIRHLERARELLDKSGWTRGQYMNIHGQRCIMGAINCAGYSLAGSDLVAASNACAARIMDVISKDSDEFTSVQRWNDDPDRTKEEVLRVFDEAIARAKVSEVIEASKEQVMEEALV